VPSGLRPIDLPAESLSGAAPALLIPLAGRLLAGTVLRRYARVKLRDAWLAAA
jgi:hypothetical protein